MSVPDGKHLLVRVHPRQPTSAAVAQLAHSLYHAGEIGREPGAVDTASIRALYTRIGERNCSTEAEDCWETRAAVAFEALVAQELNGISAPGPLPRRN